MGTEGPKNYKRLYWVSTGYINSGSYEAETFIDSSGNYFKTVYCDGYEEIKNLHIICTGERAKEIKTSYISPVYKSMKIRYNINVNKRS